MFFTTTGRWAALGARTLASLSDRFGPAGLHPDTFGLVMLQPGSSGRPEGFAHRGDWRCYPCSLVKSFHLIHALSALETGAITPHAELDRALADMITWSSNTATNYVIDVLTGTTGDTLLDRRRPCRLDRPARGAEPVLPVSRLAGIRDLQHHPEADG